MSTESTTINSQPLASGVIPRNPLPPASKEKVKKDGDKNAGAKQCGNCGFELDGPFCGRCGQPEQSMIRFFGSVVMHFLDDIFGFDSRAGRTIVPLIFRPGFLTNEYFRGRRVHYVPPLRLYFFISIVFFLLLGLFTDDSVKDLKNLQDNNGESVRVISRDIKKLQDKMAADDYVLVAGDKTRLDKLIDDRKQARESLKSSIAEMEDNIAEIKAKEAQADYIAEPGDEIQKQAFASAISMMEMNLNEDPQLVRLERVQRKLERLEHKQSLPGYEQNEKDSIRKISLEEQKAALLSGEAEVNEVDDNEQQDDNSSSGFSMNVSPQFDFLSDEDNLKLKDFFKELEGKAKTAFEQDAGPLVKQILGVLPQMMFFLLPLFALILKIYYLFSKRFYMEHLTVALHSHAFMFVILMMMASLSTLFEHIQHDFPTSASFIENVIIALALWVPMYLLIMQKKVYKQGYFFTFVKFGVVGITYIILLSFTTMVAFFWGLANL